MYSDKGDNLNLKSFPVTAFNSYSSSNYMYRLVKF